MALSVNQCETSSWARFKNLASLPIALTLGFPSVTMCAARSAVSSTVEKGLTDAPLLGWFVVALLHTVPSGAAHVIAVDVAGGVICIGLWVLYDV